LDDDLKDARRRCKTPEEVVHFLKRYLAFAAGEPEQKADGKDNAKDDNDVQEDFYPPSAFEFEPNPVIQAHLRSEHLDSLGSISTMATSTLDSYRMDTPGAPEEPSPETGTILDEQDTTNELESSYDPQNSLGPATMSTNLSSFACPECTYIANIKNKLKCAKPLFIPCSLINVMAASILLKRTDTASYAPTLAAAKRSACGQISSVTKRHTPRAKDTSVRIRGAEILSRAEIISKDT
jgi:hypothetical protein